jgi:hypothetical protein
MIHPRHAGAVAGRVQSPDIEPAAHLADLRLLGQHHIGCNEPQILELGPVTNDQRHLDRLVVMLGHVPGEPGLD